MNHTNRIEGGYALVFRALIVALAAGVAGAVPILFWVAWELAVHGAVPGNISFIAWLLIGAVAAAAVLSRLGARPISIDPDAALDEPVRHRLHLPGWARRAHARRSHA